jgi:iron complex transport system substrate-binding protein
LKKILFYERQCTYFESINDTNLRPIHQIFFFLVIVFISCQSPKTEIIGIETVPLTYAKGFEVQKGEGFWILEVNQPWTGADKSFRYLILKEGVEKPEVEIDAVVKLPVDRVILTSTTQIPHLDLLGDTDKLIGFPNFDLISSQQVWGQIESGKMTDLGSGPSANLEMMIDLQPDWVMISTLGEDLRQLDLLGQSGVPALINGEYVEQHPLGRAEWIKFTGILLGKYEEAVGVFQEIEKAYQEAETLIKDQPNLERPKVLSGVLYEDVWYLPGADSWGAKILQNAGGDYVFSDQDGSGSIQLSYEYVLDHAMEAPIWIGSADYESVEQMGDAEPRYRSFLAFQNGSIYTYTKKKGPKGGLEYFELGYVRPDLVLKDLIKILHPQLLPDYDLYFYRQLDEN